MISFIVQYKDCLSNEFRYENTINFFENMQTLLKNNYGLECIICDYGSTDGVADFIKENYNTLSYLYVKPNEGQFLNMSKCLNKGVTVARNTIIAPMATDMIIDQNTIEQIIDMFRLLGDIILRPHLVHLDKEGGVDFVDNNPYVLRKDTILRSGGWDERIYNWGKEDDDIVQRVMQYQKLIQISIRGFGYVHMWHPRTFSIKEEREVPMWKTEIMKDNFLTDGENLVNTYWKRKIR